MRAAGLLPAIVLACVAAATLRATSADDLSAPSQEVRDAAAKLVRETYHAPSREPWDKMVAALRLGDRKEQILEQLAPYYPRPQMVIGGGGAFSESYQLDSLWMLKCDYEEKSQRLFKRELFRFPQRIWAEPPKQYTGVWVTYYANGQKDSERRYMDGTVVGDDFSYDEEGRRVMVQRHDSKDNAHVEETGYYPSGRISRHGEDRHGATGTWTYYYESGSIKSESALENFGMDGTETEYNEDGSIKSRKVRRKGIVTSE